MMKKMYLLVMAIAVIFTSTIYASPNSIELLTFELTQQKSGVEIFFITAGEENCDYFIVEKATDALKWTEILKINALGTDNYGTSYTAEDQRKIKGWAHYRITQVDDNGIKHPLLTKSILLDYSKGITPSQNKTLDPICIVKQFTANRIGNNVKLNWSTGSEANIKTFLIERENSYQQWVEWIEISPVTPTGAIDKASNYIYVDQNVDSENGHKYRLSAIGYNEQKVQIGITEVLEDEGTDPRPEGPSGRFQGQPFAQISDLNIAQNNGNIKISFSAELEQNCKYFTFERSVDRVTWDRSVKITATGGINETEYAEIDYTPAQQDTYFRVFAENESGAQAELIAGTLDISSVEDIETFPNPTDGQLIIQSPNDMSNMVIKISDLEGNVLIQRANNFTRSMVLDLSDLEKGFYILSISNGKETKTEKILVDR